MRRSGILADANKINGLSKIPLVELAGAKRVLIENHQGILSYSLEEIQIKVAYGKLLVIGEKLMIMQMSREQIVITGQICSLQLSGR